MGDLDKLAKVAYEAYCESCNWIAFNGDQLKQWEQVNKAIKTHWHNAMLAVLEKLDKKQC